ncbi:uncharacterized protein LOC133521715 [Cydia pomonella]|uniref:uncharacterized protein LOC133521715 n=1 Tax=Cydia pomonella TaxID=82600 RepID=UPI002ADD42C4|nr:uncharacterized protein LOC133521715 [Cydia pomonella]
MSRFAFTLFFVAKTLEIKLIHLLSMYIIYKFCITGTSLNKMPVSWAPSKLYFLDTETCLSMHRDGILADNQCTDKLPFICYKKDPVTLSCGPKGNGYEIDRTTGSCYKFHKESKYWRDAYVACHQEDAHLAIINSYGEAAVLKDLFISNVLFRNPYGKKLRDVVHMGFVNWGREDGLWMTIDGQTLKEAGYEEWNTGEPNNKTNQWCGGMFDNGKLDDVNCGDGDPDQYSRYFICEKKPEYIYTLASETIDNESVNSNYYEYDFDY